MTSHDPQPEPTEDGGASPPPAESVPSEPPENSLDPVDAVPVDSQVGLPQPNLLVAAALTTVPVIAQLVLGFVLMVVAAVVFVIVTARPHELVRFAEDFQIVLFPIGTLTTLLVAIVVCRLFFGRTMARKVAWRGISVGQMMCVVAMTVPLAVLASEVTNCVGDVMKQFEADWLTEFHNAGAELFERFVSLPWLLVFVGGCLLPGLGEELYCRGLLSHGLVARYGVVGGTLLAAGLFGAMHIEPVQAIGAFTLGIVLQFVFLTTRSIAAPIVLHTLNNSFAFLTMRFVDSFRVPGLTPMPDGSISHTPIAVLIMAAVATLVLMAIMFQNRTRWRMPDGAEWSPGYVSAEIPDASIGAIAGREAPSPMLVCGAVVALGLFIATIISAHLAAIA